MKLTHKIKALSALLIAAGAVATSGCVSQSNTLSFTPPAPTASMNMAQSAIVTVSSKDSRSNSDIASYTRMGELVKLNAQPAPAQLFQQVMQQNLISKGFRIGSPNNANAGVTMEVKSFNATVDQGNLRYNINTKIQVVAYVQGPRGNFNKVFNATRSQSGAFNANNDEIQKVLNDTFKSIVNDIYQDQEVGAAIHQYVN